MEINVRNKNDQLAIYEEFKKHCKFCGETMGDNGVRTLNAQNGVNDNYSMIVDYLPRSSGLSSLYD